MHRSLLIYVFLVGCSSSSSGAPESADDASVDATMDGAVDAVSDLGVPLGCPPTEPTPGSPCTKPDGAGIFVCEYGGDSHGACTSIYTCSTIKDGSRWLVEEMTPGCGTNALDCPATYGAKEGEACTALNETCDYAEGRCGCTLCRGDAGNQMIWHCLTWDEAAPSGCTAKRPLLGTACGTEGQECNYARCCSPPTVGPVELCVDGAWRQGLDGACSCATPSCL